MIEDQDLGLIKEKQMPDIKAVAADLVGKGFSTEDAQKVTAGLGLNSETSDQLFSEMVALETAEAGNGPLPTPTGDVKAPVTASTKTSAAINAKPLPQAENASQPPTGPVWDLEGDDLVFDLEASMPSIQLPIIKTDLAQKEAATLLAGYTGQPEAVYREALANGDNFVIDEAVKTFAGDVSANNFEVAEKGIQEANTPEEVEAIVEDLRAKESKPVSFLDFRKNAVVKELSDVPEWLPKVDILVDEQNKLARAAQLAEERLWKDASFLGLLSDFGEILVPFSGVVEEEWAKYSRSIGEALDTLDEQGTREQKMAVLESILDEWSNTETLLFANNNTLLNADKISKLRDALYQGGVQLIDGEITSAESQEYFESALSVAFAGGEIAAVGKGLKGILNWLIGKMGPARAQDVPLSTPLRSENVVVGQEVDVKLVPEMADVREELRRTASTKNTRLFRKTLSAEKRDLHMLEGEILSGIKSRTKEIQSTGVKFKKARRQAETEVSEKLEAVYRRMEVNQQMIDEFDVAAQAEGQLSRISQFIKDGRLDESSLIKPTGRAVVQLSTRSASSAKHALYAAKPEKAVIDDMDIGAKEVAEANGMSPEQAAMEKTPTPTQFTEIGFPNTDIDRTTLNSYILSDSTLHNVGMTRAAKLESEIGNSLTVMNSATGYIPDPTKETWGTFKYLLGDGNGKGFKTASDALSAAENNILGYEHTIVSKGNGLWVEVKVPADLDLRRDVGGLTGARDNVSASWKKWFLDPLRLLGGDVLRGVFAIKSQNRAIAAQLDKKANALFKGLSPEVARDVLSALKKGDDLEQEWYTLKEFTDANGKRGTSEKAFEVYKGFREIMDDIYDIRNRNFYNKKNSLGYKLVDDGVDGNIGVRVRGSDIESDLVYDIDTKSWVKADDLDDTSIVMRLDNAIETDKGAFTFVRVMPNHVTKLPQKLLNKRKGHVDRMYRDSGWVVKTPVERVLNGKKVVSNTITHIVKTRDEAVKIADEIDGAEFSRSRENEDLDTIFADDTAVQFGYSSVHTRKRGEQLKGSDGVAAPLVNAFETLQRAIGSVEKSLDVDIIESLEARFFNEFQDILAEGKGTRWNASLSAMKKLNTSEDSDVFRAAEQWHSYINTLKGARSGKVYKMIDDAFKGFEGKGIGPFKLPAMDSQAIGNTVQALTAQVVIVGRPLFQIPQNLLQMVYVGIKDPVHGTLGVGQSIFMAAAMVGEKPNLWLIKKVMQVNDVQAAELAAEIRKSGMLDGVGRADDYLSLTAKGVDTPSTNYLAKGAKGVLKAGTIPFRASQKAQEATIKMVNLSAYLSEYNRLVKTKGRPFNAKTKEEMIYNAQRVTATQNGINQFAYQDKNNPLSIAFQFMQHIHKLFLDVVLDPAVKAATGRNIGKESSALAQTRARAAFTVMSVTSLFGLSGMLGEEGGTWAEDQLRKTFPGIGDSVVGFIVNGGIINSLTNAASNYVAGEGRSDFSGKMGPAALLDTINNFYLSNPGQLDTLGASGAVMSDVWKRIGIGGTAWAMATHPTMDTSDKVNNFLREVGGIVKGFSDYEKAVVAYHLERWPYMSTLSSGMRTTQSEAIWGMLNIQPDLVSDYYNKADFSSTKRDRSTVEGNAEAMMRAMSRKMANLQSKGELDILRSIEIVEEYVGYAKAITDPYQWDVIESEFRIKALGSETPTYEAYIRPYIERAEVGEVVQELELLKDKMPTQEGVQEVEDEIEFFRMFDQNAKEIYGR